ncbi:hypothetical protein OAQ12_04425 [Candidatus Marinimicrobia bacterium]|nr:hypothetical protein [Candidatus Neomarinimicrobiota bacterium]
MKIILPLALLLIFSCAGKKTLEVSPIMLKIDGPMKNSDEEISGMDWYYDNLILLPENLNGYAFVIKKTEIDSRINKIDTTAIRPQKIKFNTPDYKNTIPGFDSFESIAFRGYEVYVTIEIKFDDSMSCLLARGHIDEKSLEITIPEQTLMTLTVPSYVDNMSFESLIINKDRIIALFEANGDSLVEKPHALSINLSGNDIKKNTISSVNYRIADATKADGKNRFWAINYFFPGDKKTLKPGIDVLTTKYGSGLTHSLSQRVERLIEFKIINNKVMLTNSPPIEIKLEGKKTSRKWEAVARYENKGFLLATDKYPKPYTLFAYLPFN